jgi:hypothetical protein
MFYAALERSVVFANFFENNKAMVTQAMGKLEESVMTNEIDMLL